MMSKLSTITSPLQLWDLCKCLTKEVQKHPCEILFFPSLGDYFTSAISLSGFKALCQSIMSTFVIKIGRKAGQGQYILNKK